MLNLTLQSGAVVPLSLGFAALYELRETRPEDYKRYKNAYAQIDDKDVDFIFLMVDVVYTGYLCGRIKAKESLDTAMTYGDFLEELPEDMILVAQMGKELLRPKKKTASAALSNAQ